MKLEKININELKPLEMNVRRHNEKQISELVKALNQFGQTRAIVVDEDNNILIGNGLYIALKQRGDEVCDCSRVLGLTEKEKKKLILSDNKIYALGIDDYENITEYINQIAADGDFDIAGFDEEVLRQMTRELEEVEKDVMNYGVVENTIPTETTPMQSSQPVNNFAQPVSQTNTVVQTQTEKTQVAAVNNDRTIICPNCGEVIHID